MPLKLGSIAKALRLDNPDDKRRVSMYCLSKESCPFYISTRYIELDKTSLTFNTVKVGRTGLKEEN